MDPITSLFAGILLGIALCLLIVLLVYPELFDDPKEATIADFYEGSVVITRKPAINGQEELTLEFLPLGLFTFDFEGAVVLVPGERVPSGFSIAVADSTQTRRLFFKDLPKNLVVKVNLNSRGWEAHSL